MIGDAASLVDPDLIRHAAAAVLHYFKHELNRQFVSVAEFAAALERALRAVGLSIFAEAEPCTVRVLDSHLPELAKTAGQSGELFFFPQLRQALQRQLRIPRDCPHASTVFVPASNNWRSEPRRPALRDVERSDRGLHAHLLASRHPRPSLHPGSEMNFWPCKRLDLVGVQILARWMQKQKYIGFVQATLGILMLPLMSGCSSLQSKSMGVALHTPGKNIGTLHYFTPNTWREIANSFNSSATLTEQEDEGVRLILSHAREGNFWHDSPRPDLWYVLTLAADHDNSRDFYF